MLPAHLDKSTELPIRETEVRCYGSRQGSFYLFRAATRDDAARAARSWHKYAAGTEISEVRVYGTCCDCPRRADINPDGNCPHMRSGICSHSMTFTTH